ARVTARIPWCIAVRPAPVPPTAQVPVPVSGASVIAVGTIGPASTLVPAGQGAARQRVAVFVTVMVPVIATVLAGVGFITGVVCVAGETANVAIVSWPVRNTV